MASDANGHHAIKNRAVSFATQRLARRRRPVLHLLVALGVAIEGSFEIAEGNDEAGPAVDEAALDEVMLEECPSGMADRARHGHLLMAELLHAKRRVAVDLADDFLEIAKRHLPYRIAQRANRFGAQQLVAFVDRVGPVAHGAF